MIIPSTQTHTDRMKASKELAEGNAVKTQQKDTLEREIRELAAAKDILVKKSGYTPEEYRKIEDEHFKRMEIIERRISDLNDGANRAENALKSALEGQSVVARTVDGLLQQKSSLEGLIGRLTQSLSDLEKTVETASEAFRTASLRQQHELAEEGGTLGKIRAESRATMQDLERRTALVVEQERSSAIRRTDLEIYEARLRKKYPNETFV